MVSGKTPYLWLVQILKAACRAYLIHKYYAAQHIRVSRGLWRGTSPTVARLAVGVGVHFLALEFIKDAVYNFSSQGAGQKHGQLTPVQAFMSGGISRGIAAAVTCPVTVVKTRMEYVSASSIKYKVSL